MTDPRPSGGPSGGDRPAGGVTRFDEDTAPEALGGGRYAVRVARAWWIQRGPNGGYLAATIVRAMEAELAAPERQLRSLTVHFLAAPAEGPGEVAVVVERRGRGLSTVSARLTASDRLVALALAAFSGPYPSPLAYDDVERPAALAAPPHELPAPPDGPDALPFARNFRMLPVLGAPPFSGAGEAVSGGWMALAESRPLDAALVVALADAWYPAPFARLDGPTAAPTIDLTVHLRAPLPRPAEPVLGELRSTLLRDGAFEEDGRLFAPDGTLLAQSRQLALLLGP